MPRQHLASQAPAGSSAVEQLDALTALHARIRLGQATVTSLLHVPPEPNDCYAIYSRSVPASTCGAMVWGILGASGYAGASDETETVVMVGKGLDGTPWSSLLPRALDLAQCSPAISPCEQWCVTVSQTFVSRKTLVSVFSVMEGRWLYERLLRDTGFPGQGAAFSDSSGALLACVEMHDGQLLLLGFAPHSACVVQTGGTPLLDWQVRGSSIFLLRLDFVAVVHTGQQPESVTWVALPAERSGRPSLDCAPAGQAVWVVRKGHSADWRAADTSMHVSVHALSDAACHGTWRLESPGDDHLLHVQASCQAVAFWGYGTTTVYQMTAPFELGQLLYCTDVGCLAFSPDGCLLHGYSGSGREAELMYVDAHTGGVLCTVQPSTAFGADMPAGAEMITDGFVIFEDPSHVCILCDSEEGWFFCVLQW